METMSNGEALRIGQPNGPAGKLVIQQKIRRLTQRHTPSTTASIPSKYQTFFFATAEKKGFRSQAPRFSDQLDGDNCPGPGTYSQDGFKKIDVSFSKRGTGGLASKTKRFPQVRRVSPGPGMYDPKPLKGHQDFNRSDVSSNFHNPFVLQRKSVDSTPAPNSYNVFNEKIQTRGAHSVFKSTTKRDTVQPCSANPAPGQYAVKDSVLHQQAPGHEAVFKSRTDRSLLRTHDDTPGPGTYTPYTTTNPSRSLPHLRRKHYLCLSAPAMPLPPLPQPPGPGHYETQGSAVNEKQLVSGAVFLSTVSRWVGPVSKEMPGPGYYDPISLGKKSHLCKSEGIWT